METEILMALVRANIAAGAAVIAVLLLRRPVRAWFGARAAYSLRLLAPIAAMAAMLPPREVAAAGFVDVPSETLTYAAPINLAATDLAPILNAAAPHALAESFVTPMPDAAAWMLALWALGACVSGAVLVWRQQRYLAGLGPLERASADGLAVFRTLKAGVGPALVGVVRPRIVLPVDFETRFSADEQAMILAHERTHLTGGDALINALIELATCVCWFNPLAYLGAIFARRDQELACDADVVAAHPGAKRRYAEALLKTQIAMGAAPLGCAWPAQSDSPLRERIVLLNAERPHLARRLMGGAAVAALCVAAGAAAWATQPPVQTAMAEQTPRAANSSIPIALTNAQTRTYANAPIETWGTAALLRVIPEDRADIAIAMSAGASLAAPRVRMENGHIIIDGGLGRAANDCQRPFDADGATLIPGAGAVQARDLPTIIVRTPRRLDLRVRGAVASAVGALESGRVTFENCGASHMDGASGALQVGLYGFGDVDVGPVSGALTAELYGVGDMRVARAGADAEINLVGEGDLIAGPVAGALRSTLQGSGNLTIGDVGASAWLRMPGSGRLNIGAVRGALDVGGIGSGPVRVAAMRGGDINIALDGSSDVAIASGEADEMDVRIGGSSAVSFDGHARLVRAAFAAGARDVRVTRADRTERRAAQYAQAEIITGR